MTDFLSLPKNLASFSADLLAIIKLSPYFFYKVFMLGFLSSNDCTFLNLNILLYFELFFVKMTEDSCLFSSPYCLLLFHPFPKVILNKSSLSKFSRVAAVFGKILHSEYFSLSKENEDSSFIYLR